MHFSILNSRASTRRFAWPVAFVLCVLLSVAACGGEESTTASLVVPTSGPAVADTDGDDSEIAVGEPDPLPTDDGEPEPTADEDPESGPAASPTPTATESEDASPTETPEPSSTAVAEPTATASSIPFTRATPEPTARPRPTSPPRATAVPTAAPRSTDVPRPTATAKPTPLATEPRVTCSVSDRTVGLLEALAYEGSSTPLAVPVSFTFDHGDGTLDPGPISKAFYTRNGQYRVELLWESANHDGVVDCGIVTVVEANGCHVGLGPADGLGWQCGNTFCRANPLQSAPGCPGVSPFGCYIGQDGQSYCIDKEPTPPPVISVSCSISPSGAVEVGQLLVFEASTNPAGASVSFVFDHGDGTRDPGARSDAFYTAPGFYTVRLEWSTATNSGVITCGTVEVVSEEPESFLLTCFISDTQIVVGEVTEFSAEVTGPAPPLSVAFLHGDGSRDARAVSQAVYNAPGVYRVQLEWQTDTDSGVAECGNVTVT